jgi:predicted LPLAT superfamily acyltransferase
MPYIIGSIVLWNAVLGVGLFLFESRYFGLAVAGALLAAGIALQFLSSQSEGRLSRTYRTSVASRGQELGRIRVALRSYGFAFLLAGGVAFLASVKWPV